MPQAHYENDVTILAPVLKAQLELLQSWLEQQFADVRADIARLEHQIDGLDAHQRERCGLIEQQLSKHDERIRMQERQGLWRWAATALSVVLAYLGLRMPD